ncbi:MAG: hypothetical protein IT168_10655 [Bryobacterales bacterium]|nr:hypothetical protein [Bryobacterales bacterium]
MFKLEEAVKYFRAHEGVVPHMYLDIVGLVTVGVGFLLRTPENAVAMPFVNRKTGKPATAAEKRADWAAVNAQEKAKLAATYKKFTQLDMTDADIDKRLGAFISEFAAALRRQFNDFDSYPQSVQIGLLDMVYSLGADGFQKGYPKLCAAVLKKDWAAAANECERKGVSPTRNKDCKQLFLDAVQAGSNTGGAGVGMTDAAIKKAVKKRR